jgi:lipopolysaccharide/colanic/teichoic acid biosynthesis glycosyltransferase
MYKGGVKTSLSKPAAVSVPAAMVHKVREPLLKRPLHIILSTFMLILSLPGFLPIDAAIKMEDGG